MQFSPIDTIQYAWEMFKKRPWFFMGAAVILAIANLGVGVLSVGADSLVGGSLEDQTVVGRVVSYGLGALVSMGAIAFFLTAYDNLDGVEYGALWHPSGYGNFFMTSILASGAMIIGLVLLIVPGLIAMVLLMFSTVLVIDRGLGPIDALKASIAMTRGNRWPLFGFMLLCMLISLVGVLAFGIGLLVAIPIILLALMHAYRQLSGTSKDQLPDPDVFS